MQKGNIMSSKQKIDEFEECAALTLEDCDLDSAEVVNPTGRLKKTYPLSLRLHKVDILEAKIIGRKKGIPYQTLLKSYIREGIQRDKSSP
mgnify:CR=1 FL=1